MYKTLVGLISVIALSLSAGQSRMFAQKKDDGPVRVFVFAADVAVGADASAAAGRADSVKDLQAALGKSSSLSVVDVRDQADVTIEVVSRGDEETGETVSVTTSSPVSGAQHVDTTKEKDAVVRVKLTAGSDVLNMQGTGGGALTTRWRTAAGNAAKSIERWIKTNRARLVTARGQSPS